MPADAFRPRTTSELLDASIQMLRAHYASFLALSVIGLLPQILLNIYNVSVLVPQYAERAILYSLPLLLISWLWFAIMDAAIVKAASDAYLGEAIAPRAVLRQALGRTGTIVLAMIVKYVLIFVGYVLVMIAAAFACVMLLAVVWGIMAVTGHGLGGVKSPGFAVALGVIAGIVFVSALLWWIFFASARMFAYRPAIMIERCDADASLRRSNTLTRGNTMKVVLVFLLAFIIYFAALLLLFGIVYLASGRSVVAQATYGIAGIFAYPLVPIVTTLLYYDLRMRKEGYDIELMAGALELRDAGSGMRDAALPRG
ncbi:MAG TPA: hypothetical protein VFJ96_05795 [Gemmatimonadaceae bacterium]|nr:hypothetical protein [Gemmatimonadaceae bacterium]